MDELLVAIQLIFWAVALVIGAGISIYLVVRRLEERKREKFEKRSN